MILSLNLEFTIFNKYETQCNIKNSKLTKLDDTCTFENDVYAHGGHPCNAEGLWDLINCIKVYCDKGYFLDYTENKCVEDPCAEKDDSTDQITDSISDETTDDKSDESTDNKSDETTDGKSDDTTDNNLIGNMIQMNKIFVFIISLILLI